MRTVKRILVTGAGGPGAVNMTRSLLLADEPVFLVGCDASPHYLFLAETHVRARVPRCREIEPYLAAVNALVDEHALDLLLPNNSLEAAVLSEHRARLHAPVFLPRPSTLAAANDKWATYELFRDAGLPVPHTVLLSEPGDVGRAFAEVGTRPVWVRGAGIPGRGVGVASLPCRTAEQATGWVDFWQGWGGMTASEYLPGDNLTWIGLWKGGELVTSQGRRRLAYVIPHVSPSGITGAPAISHTIHRADVNELGEAAVMALDPGYDGVAFVDFKCDERDGPRITEVNAGRFGTTHHFYTAAGLNLPWLLVRLALGEPLPAGLPRRDALPADLYWIRTLDCGPVLVEGARIAAGDVGRLPAPPHHDAVRAGAAGAPSPEPGTRAGAGTREE